jgi:hypothetical protein
MIPTVDILLLGEVLLLDICDGADIVDDGELMTRHDPDMLPDGATSTVSDTPACLPCESVIKNKRGVPALTSATQV